MLKPIEMTKIALMAEGLTISAEARAALQADEPDRPLTLAEYATTSGLTLRLGEDMWVNAPITEYNPNFVAQPPHRLEFERGRLFVRWQDFEVDAVAVPVPDYYDQKDPTGEPYTSFGITHTDRVRISPIEGCAIACQFCDLPYEYRYRRKTVDQLIDFVGVALRDPRLPARHVLISGGTPRPVDYGYENDVYARVCETYPGVEVDLMMVPMPGLLDPARLYEIGIHELSINLEMYNEQLAPRVMAGKAKLGRQHYLDFIGRAVEVFGSRRVRSLILVGLEEVDDTLRGVKALAERGCQPVLSPFRPDPSTPMRGHAPPTVQMLAEVYERSAEIVARHGVRLGPSCVPCQHNTLTFPDASQPG